MLHMNATHQMKKISIVIFSIMISGCLLTHKECSEPKERHIFTELRAEYPECSVQMYIEPPGPVERYASACYEPEYIKCDVSGKPNATHRECNFCLMNDPDQLDDNVSCNLDGSCNHTY